MNLQHKILPRIFRAMLLPVLILAEVHRSEAQTWATNSPLLVARWHHTATLLTNGDILIAGGLLFNTNGFSANTNACELYNPLTGSPAFTGFMQDNRDSHTATLLTNGQVLIAGGGGDATSEIYDPGSGSWGNLASMNDERVIHTATLLPNGQVLVAGGYDDNSGQDLSSAEIYDPGSGTWTNTAPMPYQADTLAAVLLTNGMVLVCGGSDASQGVYAVTNASLYNPNTQTWTNTAPMNEARAGHTATLLPNGTVLVEGGTGDASAEVYDPVSATWSMVASMNDGRYASKAASLTNGQVMVMGDGNPDVEIYDPIANVWSLTDPLPVPGNLQTLTVLAGGQAVVTGGSGTQYNGPALAVVETWGTVQMVPSLTVTASPSNGVSPLFVQFTSPATDSGGNTVTNWNWSFGDGTMSQLQNPTHTYTNIGTFAPGLIAYSTFGSLPLAVNGPEIITVSNLSLAASAYPQVGLAALTVQFSTPGTDSGGYTVTNWNWSFGDGTFSSAQNPTHTYVNAGAYSPSLMAWSTYSSQPINITPNFGIITVTNSANPLFRLIHNFTTRSGSSLTNIDGAGPNGGLIMLNNLLYGTTQHGGGSGDGVLYAVGTNGSAFTNLYYFVLNNGGIPPAGVVASGNKLFGTTYLGGPLNGGTVFAINSDGTGYSNILNFNLNFTPGSGAEPLAGLVLANNTLFGTTWYGGSYNYGTVFYVTTNGDSSGLLHSFYTLNGSNGNLNGDGLYPSAPLIFANGTLYGTAEQGGDYGSGTVFSVITNDPASFSPLHYFTATSPGTGTNADGALPFSGLVVSGNTLYGTTFGGGAAGNGAVFAISTDGTVVSNLYSFSGGSDGSSPHGGLVLIGSVLYGTTSGGGTFTNGTLFSVHTDGSHFKSLYSFTGGDDGAAPEGELLLANNVIYGVATGGGSSGSGTIFSYTLPVPVRLSIAAAGTNVILTWPGTAAGFTLQSSTLLGTGAVWNAVSPLPVLINTRNTVTNLISGREMFYRLSQ